MSQHMKKNNSKIKSWFETVSPFFGGLLAILIVIGFIYGIFWFSSLSSQRQWEEVSTAVHYAIENEYTLLIDGVPVDLENLDFSKMPNIYSVNYINDDTETVYLRRNVRGGIY